MTEAFKPIANRPPDSLLGWLRFRVRLLFDLQVASVYRDLKRTVPGWRGRIADIGAGAGPYRHLLDQKNTEYIGLDSSLAQQFDYEAKDVTYYDGDKLPLADNSVDGLICTEVLEHVADPGQLVRELRRVLKPAGKGIITVPWSARYHYIPHDYYRYTPAALEKLFGDFSAVEIRPRGTDLTAIAAKVMVAYLRMFRSVKSVIIDLVPIIIFLPLAAASFLAGRFINLGSADDPLGYTVWVTK